MILTVSFSRYCLHVDYASILILFSEHSAFYFTSYEFHYHDVQLLICPGQLQQKRNSCIYNKQYTDAKIFALNDVSCSSRMKSLWCPHGYALQVVN